MDLVYEDNLDVHHECGIGAVYLKNFLESSAEVPNFLIQMGLAMQARGQKSAGISVLNPRGFRLLSTYKDTGLVKEVFHLDDPYFYRQILKRYRGNAGSVHTRYSTSGKARGASQNRDEVQPFERRHGKKGKRFSLVFNGNLANYNFLRNKLSLMDYRLDTYVDTEVLMHLIATNIRKLEGTVGENNPIDLFKVAECIAKEADGAYNFIVLFGDGNLLAFRDRLGFHPLVFGENEKIFAVASESSALERIGISKPNFRDFMPGEAMIIKDGRYYKRNVLEPKPRHCHFEYVYFARSQSEIDGVYVRKARFNLGRELAKNEPLKNKLDSSYLVVPAPWTAVPAAQEFARELNLELRLAVEKAEIVRGFINKEYVRRRIIEEGYIVHRDVEGRKVFIIDDSMVRGETLKQLLSNIREKGATEVHARLTEPPIKYPCFYGIDFPTMEELAVNKFKGDLNALVKWIEADSIHFQNIEGLVRGIGIPRENLCMACLTGEYPTPCGQRRYNNMIKQSVINSPKNKQLQE